MYLLLLKLFDHLASLAGREECVRLVCKSQRLGDVRLGRSRRGDAQGVRGSIAVGLHSAARSSPHRHSQRARCILKSRGSGLASFARAGDLRGRHG
eukprot:1889624-Pleurochrysis_carterae.AAC.1